MLWIRDITSIVIIDHLNLFIITLEEYFVGQLFIPTMKQGQKCEEVKGGLRNGNNNIATG